MGASSKGGGAATVDPIWKQEGYASPEDYRTAKDNERQQDIDMRNSELSASLEESRRAFELQMQALNNQLSSGSSAAQEAEAEKMRVKQAAFAKAQADEADKERARARLRRGRQSTLVTSGEGLLTQAPISLKTLLGA